MERLKSQDLRSFISWINHLQFIEDIDSFQVQAMNMIKEILSCDSAIFNDFTPRLEPLSYACDSPEYTQRLSKYQIDFPELIQDHPFADHYPSLPLYGAYKISDFVKKDQYYRLTVFNEFYRHIDIEYQIGFQLPIENSTVHSYVFNRQKKDFSERDRTILNLTIPPLAQAYQSHLNRARLKQISLLLQKNADTHKEGIVLITREGEVGLCNQTAAALFEKYFGLGSRCSNPFPAPLTAWLGQQTAQGNCAEPYSLEIDGRRLEIRLIQDKKEGLKALLMREKEISLSLRLEQYALTIRETEVLEWLAKGKTNFEIGFILGVSPRTVQKHLEHIYIKLGVESRTAAAARIFSAE